MPINLSIVPPTLLDLPDEVIEQRCSERGWDLALSWCEKERPSGSRKPSVRRERLSMAELSPSTQLRASKILTLPAVAHDL
jgi:hypothetical protein